MEASKEEWNNSYIWQRTLEEAKLEKKIGNIVS